MQISSPSQVQVPRSFLAFFSVLAAVGPFAMQVYVPAIPDMVQAFGSNINVLNSTISSYMIGNALGQLLGGPISDQVGRKRIAKIGLGIFLLATLWIIFAPSIEQVIMGRLLQALGGGFASVICLASVRDVYPPLEAGRKYAMVLIFMLIAPMLAPFIGAYLLDYGWQMIFWAVFFYGLIALVWYQAGIPETRIVEAPEIDFSLILNHFNRVITKKVGNLRPILYSLSIAFSTGVVMTFLTQAAFVYMEYFGVSAKDFPYLVAVNTIVLMSCMYYSMQRQKKVHPHFLYKKGSYIQLSVVLLLFLYVVFFDPELYIVVPMVALTQGTMGLVYPNGVSVFISHYEKLSGSATSLNLMFLFGLGSVLGSLPALFYDGSLVPVMGVMLFSSITCILIGRCIPAPDLSKSNIFSVAEKRIK